jgi:hypothetical protein
MSDEPGAAEVRAAVRRSLLSAVNVYVRLIR